MAGHIGLDPVGIQTNIVIFDIAKTGLPPAEFLGRLKSSGILAGSVGGTRIRLVTHYDVSRARTACAPRMRSRRCFASSTWQIRAEPVS